MKVNKLKKLAVSLMFSTVALMNTSAFAKITGGDSGGGGDANEIRVNEIRADILSWINKGGAHGLMLPEYLSLDMYQQKMTDILQEQKVILSFNEQEVLVDGVEKTCRGWVSDRDEAPHIQCNISRFNNTIEADQYKLIHHEYAGLARLESNLGAASDYNLSSQITSYLKKTIVLKLAISKGAPETRTTQPSICSASDVVSRFVQMETIDRVYKKKSGIISKIFGKKKQDTLFATAHLKDIVVDEDRLEVVANYCFPAGNIDGKRLGEVFTEVRNYIVNNSIATMGGCLEWTSDVDYSSDRCTYVMTSKDALYRIITELTAQLINNQTLSINPRYKELIFNGSNQPRRLVTKM